MERATSSTPCRASEIGREQFGDDPVRLAVRITRRGGAKPPEDLRLVAAPAEMWSTATEVTLPSWPVTKEGRLAIPLDPSQPWRLRVIGTGEGSWWVEVERGQRTAFLTSTPAVGIDVAVFDAKGKPAADVNAFVQEPAGRSLTLQKWTRLYGGTGKLAVPGLPDEAEVTLSILKEGSPPLLLRGRPSALPHEIRLSAGAELSGRLLDRRGLPITGARIEAEGFAASDLPRIVRLEARSGTDGRWLVSALPDGKIAWSVRAAGYVPIAETTEVHAGAREDVGSRTLEPGTTLAIQVVDDATGAVAGARVNGASLRIEATADANGIARLTDLPAGSLEIKASAAHHLAGALRLSPPFPRRPQLLLPRAFTVMGRFVDASGAPVSRGSARLDSGRCRREANFGAGEHGDGRFEFDLPPDGTAATLVLRSPEVQELRIQVAPGKAGEIRDLGDLKASAGLSVTGRIVREDDGSPIQGARIWTTRQGPDGPSVAWAVRDLLEAVAGEDGRFQLSGLLPVPMTLRVEAAGFARTQLPLDPQSADTGRSGAVDIGTISLRDGATLHVRVEDHEIVGAVARADVGNHWLEADMLTAQVWNGEATLPNVPAGKVLVSVLAGKRLLCEQAVTVDESVDQDMDCRHPSLAVRGRVEFGGAPAPSGTLLWQMPNDVPGRIDTMVSPGGLRHQEVVGLGRPQVDVPLGTDGRFETTDLVPGLWQVTWVSEGISAGPVSTEIPDVESFDTVLSFSGLAITGTVVDREGKPVEGARVREMTSGTLSLSGADGRFTLAGLRPGKALVQAELKSEKSPLSEVELTDQLPDPVHLVLGDEKTLVLTVQVLDGASTPLPGAFVFLAEDGKGVRLLTTAADGKAMVTLEPPLAPRVRAAANANGIWGFGAWTSREAARDGLTVAVAGAGTLLVHSTKREGSPVITTPDDWDLSWLLRLLGAIPQVSVKHPLEVTGLPAGPYRVSLEPAGVTIAVEEGKASEGTIE